MRRSLLHFVHNSHFKYIHLFLRRIVTVYSLDESYVESESVYIQIATKVILHRKRMFMRILFVDANRCWSYVGQAHISGGQPISIGVGCDKVGIVLHEIMHAVGFFHTSSRYDRDSYVVVRYENIMQGTYL